MIQKNWAKLLLSVYLLCPFSGFSAVFTVNSTLDSIDVNPGDGICAIGSDSNQCSLRAAIMETNALTNVSVDGVEIPDEININDGRYWLFRVGSGEDASDTGDLDITDSVIITGNTSDRNAVTIDARGYRGIRDRVFHILSDNKVINVEFNYLSIIGGYSVDTRGGGGGICIKCVASDAEAYQPTELGTMNPDINTTFNPVNNFFNADTTRPIVTLRHVEIRNNYELISGSGIMNAGVLTIEDSLIHNNSSSYHFGMATGQNGQFTNNSQFVGGGNGGAISNWGGKLTIRRTIISNNISQTGGAIYSQNVLAQFRDEQVVIENSQLTRNRAFMGGAIFNVSGDWEFPTRQLIDYGFVINNTTIDNNRAEFAGGAIYNLGLGAMQLSNVTVTANEAADPGLPIMPNKGGGIYHSGKILDIVNSTISGNTSQNPRLEGMATADNATGGNEIFLDVVEANADPTSNLPWRFTLLNSIVGIQGSTDACNGTIGYENFIVNIGGNVDDSGTCLENVGNQIINSLSRSYSRAESETETILGQLANNGGIPGNELPDETFPPTLALKSGAAIGYGVNCNSNDQRGFGREVGSCDAGAFQTTAHTKGISNVSSQLPVARNDVIVTTKDVSVSVPVSVLLANDNDPLQRGAITFNNSSVQLLDQNGDSVNVASGTQANNSSLIKFLNFTPALGFVGQATFSYNIQVTDDETGETYVSEDAIVTVEIKEQNVAPIAYSQLFFASPGESIDSDLYGGLTNYSNNRLGFDLEQSTLEYVLGNAAEQGVVSIDVNGSFSYVANADAKGTDGFTYSVRDAEGALSAPASVTVYLKTSDITSMQDVSQSVAPGKIVSVDLSSGAEGNFFFGLQRNTKPSQGEILWLNERTGELLYQANETANGDDTFGFSVIDLQANSSAGQVSSFDGSVSITISSSTSTDVNNAPESLDQTISLSSGVSKRIFLQANEIDDDALIYQIHSEPEIGRITQFDPATGSLLYLSDGHSGGSVSFEFKATDGLAESNLATININLTDISNIAPIAIDDSAMTPSDLTISVNVLANDTDENNDNLQITTDAVSSQQGGVVTVRNNKVIRYTPPENFVGEDVVDYQVTDGFGGSDSGTLRISVITPSEGSYQNSLPSSSSQSEPANDETNSETEGQQSSEDNAVPASTTGPIEVSESSGAVFWLLGLWILLLNRRCRARLIR